MKPLPLAFAPKEPACTGCGDCCRVITLSVSKTEIVRGKNSSGQLYHGTPGDRTWAKNLVPVKPEEVQKLAPHRILDPNRKYLYRCPDFNYETAQCENYENRPRVCSEFPAYGDREYVFTQEDLPRCGYWSEDE